MGGTINVSSKLGEGSCFSFHLLLQRNQQPSSLSIPEIDISQLRILIVDDNQTNRMVLRGQLEQWGATIEEAESGHIALQQCEQNLKESPSLLYDIAIVDMQMPEMDGMQLAQQLQADAHFKPVKLIMMTSINNDENNQYYADHGFSAFFHKPTTASDLLNALRVIISDGEIMHQAKPLITHDYLQTLNQTEASSSQNKNNQLSKSSRILIVEDNHVNQLVVQGILNFNQLESDLAEDGLDALKLLQQHQHDKPYDLILMDCQMPKMDGYEATRQIRAGKAGEQHKNTPIIAMTAHAMTGDRQLCLDAGMNDYMTKPVDSDLLLETLHRWLPTIDIMSTDDTAITESVNKNNTDTPPPLTEEKPIVWDQDDALQRAQNMEDLLILMIETFLEEIPDQQANLEKAVKELDY